MNKEKLLAVADVLEKHLLPGIGFNMADYVADDQHDNSGHNCGTVCCIAGTAVIMEHGKEVLEWRNKDIRNEAQKILGLTIDEGDALFIPRLAGLDLSSIPMSAAISTLRHAAKTGEINKAVWEKFL